MPNILVDRARNNLQLFQRISDSIMRPKTDQVTAWVPGFEWFLRPDNVYELATSLMQKQRKSRFEKRSLRVHQAPFGRLNLTPRPASIFYFRLMYTRDLDQPKLEASNRLLRIALHLGFALLVMLIENGVITETRQEALRREQTGRHLANDTTTRVSEIVPNHRAPTLDKQHRFYKTVNAFFAADDTLRARSRVAEWPEFE